MPILHRDRLSDIYQGFARLLADGKWKTWKQKYGKQGTKWEEKLPIINLRVVRTITTLQIQKYAKAVVIKTTWAIILMTPNYLLEASGGPVFAARWLDYCTQEAVLSQGAAKCSLHNYVNSASVNRNWTWVCFATSWGSGVGHNGTFFVKYALKSRALYAASPWKLQSACFCLSYEEKCSVIGFLS